MAVRLHITRRHARRSLAVAWASPHFHLRCATVKTSHTPETLAEIAPPNFLRNAAVRGGKE